MQCLACHAIAGAGGRVGPGLESLGASAPVDYLVDSLVEPNKAVKEGYHGTVIATVDGRVVTGIVVGQTDGALVLRDAEDREISLPLASIDERKDAGSLMPAGLVDGLPRRDLVDLVRFLSELGKLGPYAVDPQARVARRWQVATGLADPNRSPNVDLATAIPLSVDATVVAPVTAWAPAYSTVAGTLPGTDLPAINAAEGRFTLVRTGIEATTPGPVRVAISPRPSLLYLDGRLLDAGPDAPLDLTPRRAHPHARLSPRTLSRADPRRTQGGRQLPRAGPPDPGEMREKFGP